MSHLNSKQNVVARLTMMMLFAIIAVSSIGTFSSCKKEEDQIPADTAKSMAKDFTIKSLAEDTVMLSDYSNKVVVLFFFGYSCSYCKASAPEIQNNLVTPYATRTDYAVAGLDIWNGTNSAVEAFRSSTGLNVTMLLNASAVGADYNTTNDRLIVIDKMGHIRFKGNQSAIKDIDAAKQTVNALLAP